MTIISRPILKVGLQSQKDSNTRRLTTGSVGWNMLKRRLQIEVGRMWSCTPLLPGRIPRNAKKTARGEPMQKKFSTCNTCNAWGNKRHSPWEALRHSLLQQRCTVARSSREEENSADLLLKSLLWYQKCVWSGSFVLFL